jgi:hypothetical protein
MQFQVTGQVMMRSGGRATLELTVGNTPAGVHPGPVGQPTMAKPKPEEVKARVDDGTFVVHVSKMPLLNKDVQIQISNIQKNLGLGKVEWNAEAWDLLKNWLGKAKIQRKTVAPLVALADEEPVVPPPPLLQIEDAPAPPPPGSEAPASPSGSSSSDTKSSDSSDSDEKEKEEEEGEKDNAEEQGEKDKAKEESEEDLPPPDSSEEDVDDSSTMSYKMLQEAFEDKESENAVMQQTISALDQENDEQRVRIDTLEADCDKYEETLSAMREEIEVLKKRRIE